MVLVAGGLGLPPPAPERPGFTFSGRLRASDSTTIATTFASADADRDAGWAWALTSSLRGAKQAREKVLLRASLKSTRVRALTTSLYQDSIQ